MTTKQSVGALITGVSWVASAVKNYTRYFITTKSSGCYEVTVAGLKACELVKSATSLDAEFREILGKAKIADIRTDDRKDLAILLDTGQLMMLCGTYDGETTGNNFYLQAS